MFEFLKRKLRKSYDEAQLKALLDESSDLIIFVGTGSKVVAVNSKVSSFFGFNPTDFIGQSVDSLVFIPPDSPKNTALLDAIKHQREFTCEDPELVDKYKIKVKVACNIEAVNALGQNGILIVISRTAEQSSESLAQSNVDFLTKTPEDLQKILTEEDLYRYAADGVVKLIPKSWTSVTRLVDEKTIEIVATATSEPEFLKTLKLLMKDPIGKRYTIDERASFFMQKNKLVPLEGGIYALTFGQLPKPICDFAQKAAKITGVYVMAFVSEGKIFGNVAVVTASREEIKNIPVIEAFINQVSVALAERRAQDSLKKIQEREAGTQES
jgi:PAS domain S-box-containing protein